MKQFSKSFVTFVFLFITLTSFVFASDTSKQFTDFSLPWGGSKAELVEAIAKASPVPEGSTLELMKVVDGVYRLCLVSNDQKKCIGNLIFVFNNDKFSSYGLKGKGRRQFLMHIKFQVNSYGPPVASATTDSTQIYMFRKDGLVCIAWYKKANDTFSFKVDYKPSSK